MFVVLLAVQLAVGDTNYSSPALRQLVGDAAAANAAIPASLNAYRVRAESEVSLLLRGPGGRENVTQVEQMSSDYLWRRPGRVDQRVIGYRTEQLALTVSSLSYLRQPWIVPMLYGNRLRLLVADRTSDSSSRAPIIAIHPLAQDRDSYYRFQGGDTVAVLHLGERVIPVVRILVEPYRIPASRSLLFRGEMEIDAARNQLIRMRGELVLGRPRSVVAKAASHAFQMVAFAELVNGEIREQYWLPSYQRIEVQAVTSLATEYRPVFRLITRFRDHELNQETEATTDGILPGEFLTFAPGDSLNGFGGWNAEIGAVTAGAHTDDFNDVAPDQWRPSGKPRLDIAAERLSDVLRTNRVEGVYTGLAAKLRFRDAAPGLTATVTGGWAWSEQTARGSASLDWSNGAWRMGVRAQRALAQTNDFVLPLREEASVLGVLTTSDDFDYVDRRSATVGLMRRLGAGQGGLLRVELGPGDDRPEISRLRYGVFHGDIGFRANRPVTPGSYFRGLVGLELHPNVSGQYFQPGIGAGISFEQGAGQLSWQRIEARLLARHAWGPVTYGARVDGAAVLGRDVPPQQLLEIGWNEGLPGYGYKEFGGNRAAIMRLSGAYQLPVLRSPVRLFKWLFLPSVSPSFSVGLQGGWAGWAATAGDAPPLTPTDGIRSTVNFAVRLFGGAIGVGVARPLDHQAGWRVMISADQQW